jgi:hypothetical protein
VLKELRAKTQHSNIKANTSNSCPYAGHPSRYAMAKPTALGSTVALIQDCPALMQDWELYLSIHKQHIHKLKF